MITLRITRRLVFELVIIVSFLAIVMIVPLLSLNSPEDPSRTLFNYSLQYAGNLLDDVVVVWGYSFPIVYKIAVLEYYLSILVRLFLGSWYSIFVNLLVGRLVPFSANILPTVGLSVLVIYFVLVRIANPISLLGRIQLLTLVIAIVLANELIIQPYFAINVLYLSFVLFLFFKFLKTARNKILIYVLFLVAVSFTLYLIASSFAPLIAGLLIGLPVYFALVPAHRARLGTNLVFLLASTVLMAAMYFPYFYYNILYAYLGNGFTYANYGPSMLLTSKVGHNAGPLNSLLGLSFFIPGQFKLEYILYCIVVVEFLLLLSLTVRRRNLNTWVAIGVLLLAISLMNPLFDKQPLILKAFSYFQSLPALLTVVIIVLEGQAFQLLELIILLTVIISIIPKQLNYRRRVLAIFVLVLIVIDALGVYYVTYQNISIYGDGSNVESPANNGLNMPALQASTWLMDQISNGNKPQSLGIPRPYIYGLFVGSTLTYPFGNDGPVTSWYFDFVFGYWIENGLSQKVAAGLLGIAGVKYIIVDTSRSGSTFPVLKSGEYYLSYFNESPYFHIIYQNGPVYIFENELFYQSYDTSSIYFIDGGMLDLYNVITQLNDSSRAPVVLFIDHQPLPLDLLLNPNVRKNIVLGDYSTVYDFAALFINESNSITFLPAAELSKYETNNLALTYDTGGSVGNLRISQNKWEFTYNLNYGQLVNFASPASLVVKGINIRSEGRYFLWMRVLSGPDVGVIRTNIGNYSYTLYTRNQSFGVTGYKWFVLPLNLERQTYNIDIQITEGIQAINMVALTNSTVFSQALSKADQILTTSNLMYSYIFYKENLTISPSENHLKLTTLNPVNISVFNGNSSLETRLVANEIFLNDARGKNIALEYTGPHYVFTLQYSKIDACECEIFLNMSLYIYFSRNFPLYGIYNVHIRHRSVEGVKGH